MRSHDDGTPIVHPHGVVADENRPTWPDVLSCSPASVQATRRILRRSGVHDSSSAQEQIGPEKARDGERTDREMALTGVCCGTPPVGSATTWGFRPAKSLDDHSSCTADCVSPRVGPQLFSSGCDG
jgi:hypothetical protein